MCANVSAGSADFICSSEVRQIEEVACYVQNVWGLVHDEREDYTIIFGVACSAETLLTNGDATRCHSSKNHDPETLCSWSKITSCTFSLENPETFPQLLGIEKNNHVDGYDQSTLPDRNFLFRLIILLYLCLCLKSWAFLSWSRNFLLLWNPGIHYCSHKTPPLKRIMSWLNSTSNFKYYFSNYFFNIPTHAHTLYTL